MTKKTEWTTIVGEDANDEITSGKCKVCGKPTKQIGQNGTEINYFCSKKCFKKETDVQNEC